MPLRQDFAEQVKAQTEVWRGQIKAYQEQMEQAEWPRSRVMG